MSITYQKQACGIEYDINEFIHGEFKRNFCHAMDEDAADKILAALNRPADGVGQPSRVEPSRVEIELALLAAVYGNSAYADTSADECVKIARDGAAEYLKSRLAAPRPPRTDKWREAFDVMESALRDVLNAQAAGELSYRTSSGCGYEAMLEVEKSLSLAAARKGEM